MAEEASNEEAFACAKCGTAHEDILILGCDHNLCLLCAAKNLQREEAKSTHKYQTVICEICGSNTTIDPSSAEELLSLLGSGGSLKEEHYTSEPQIRKVTRSPRSLGEKDMPPLLDRNERVGVESRLSGAENRLDNNRHLIGQLRPQCKDHPEEMINYYCFDCECAPICPECVVHGLHRNHEVQTIKKAYPLIRGRIEDMILEISRQMDDLLSKEEVILKRKNELIMTTNQLKLSVTSAFEELNFRLQTKENELLDSADLYKNEYMKEIETNLQLVSSHQDNLRGTMDYIRNQIDTVDEVGFIEFYSNKKLGIQERIAQNLPEVKEATILLNSKCNIDTRGMSEFINNIQSLHLQITNISVADTTSGTGIQHPSKGEDPNDSLAAYRIKDKRDRNQEELLSRPYASDRSEIMRKIKQRNLDNATQLQLEKEKLTASRARELLERERASDRKAILNKSGKGIRVYGGGGEYSLSMPRTEERSRYSLLPESSGKYSRLNDSPKEAVGFDQHGGTKSARAQRSPASTYSHNIQSTNRTTGGNLSAGKKQYGSNNLMVELSTKGKGKSPLTALALRRLKKISDSPAFQKYMTEKNQ